MTQPLINLIIIILLIIIIFILIIKNKNVTRQLESTTKVYKEVSTEHNNVKNLHDASLKKMHEYKNAYDTLINIFKTNPVALAEGELRTAYEVKGTGSIVCRFRIRKPIEKKVIKSAQLVYNVDKDTYITLSKLQGLRSIQPRDLEQYIKSNFIKIISKKR